MSQPRFVDLSYPLHSGTPVFPGDPPIEVIAVQSTRDPSSPDRPSLNCGRISTGIHVGTHMDAPYHFFDDGLTIDQVPLAHCIGGAVLIEVSSANPEIGAEHLRAHIPRLRRTSKVVLRTGWSAHWSKPDYFTAHPVLSPEAARLLVDCGVHLVGVDMPSVDLPPYPAHRVLLGSGVLILENLVNLENIQVDDFALHAVPLRLFGRDGSPVRAMAIIS